MFTCPYQHCDKTFSRRVAFREHTKSYKGQAYWEILNNLSDDFSNCIAECFKNTNENNKDKFDGMNEMMVNFIDLKLRVQEQVDDDGFSVDEDEALDFLVDEDEALDYTIKVEEFAFEHYNYNLHTSKLDQTSSIDVRSILI
ncbi:17311_t:CDS:2 [Funneliformis geosporum]|nr:17311_t:CDS:2 [Funneliformis geosporum]